MLIRTLNRPKTKWDDAEEPTINNFYKLITENFEYALKSADRQKPPQYFTSREVDRNTPWRQVSLGTHMVHHQRHMPIEKNKLERDFQKRKSWINN